MGIDFTERMLDRARSRAAMMGLTNAEFVYGTMEEIPLPDASADVVISNGVINLSTKKGRVFAECFPVPLDKARLGLYPLFTEQFLDWLFRD